MRAIREGNVHLKFDADFVFSEVNGDKIDWVSQVSVTSHGWDVKYGVGIFTLERTVAHRNCAHSSNRERHHDQTSGFKACHGHHETVQIPRRSQHENAFQ